MNLEEQNKSKTETLQEDGVSISVNILDIDKHQIAWLQHRRPYRESVQVRFFDATVYESHITYPADTRLIWRSCANVFAMLQDIGKKIEAKRQPQQA